MILYDFRCPDCDEIFEALVKGQEEKEHPCACGGVATRIISALHVFTTIVPTTRTSKKYKAGYAHQYVNRPAEKTSVSVPRTSTIIEP